MQLWELDEQIRAVCPIEGINSDGLIFFANEATPQQRLAAQAIMDAHLSEVA